MKKNSLYDDEPNSYCMMEWYEPSAYNKKYANIDCSESFSNIAHWISTEDEMLVFKSNDD